MHAAASRYAKRVVRERRTTPYTSLDLIHAPQCRTPKPVDDTADDLLLACCSKTGVTVTALLLNVDDFLVSKKL